MFLRELQLTNFLSYGPDTLPLELGPLNVFIGPNGSGKSNLIEAVRLLQAAPTGISNPVRQGGGVQDWIWKGNSKGIATIDVVASNPAGSMPLRHQLAFRESGHRFEVMEESIENERPHPGEQDADFYYRYSQGHPVLNVNEQLRFLRRGDVLPDESILSQRKDPDQYPEITRLGNSYSNIRIYRDWIFGRHAPAREAQNTDLDNRRLAEDFMNLGMVLNRLKLDLPVKRQIVEGLNELYSGISDYDTAINANKVQVVLFEDDVRIPATRLSDGTLRWLCLLAILLDPKPSSLACIEEPELGLHPDVLPYVAQLLRDASQRTQLIVTTHSEILVDAFSESPESVVVCERHEGCTTVERLSAESLAKWLEKYSLGQLWSRGEVGGNRW